MLYLAATLHTLGVRMTDRANEAVTRSRERPEEGASAVEWAMIVAAVIVIVGVVIVAIQTFVDNEVAKIQ